MPLRRHQVLLSHLSLLSRSNCRLASTIISLIPSSLAATHCLLPLLHHLQPARLLCLTMHPLPLLPCAPRRFSAHQTNHSGASTLYLLLHQSLLSRRNTGTNQVLLWLLLPLS